MGDRDEILMNFQAITGMEDIGVCLDILEQKNWDLMAAVGGVMPQNEFSNSSSNGPSDASKVPTRAGDFIDLTNDADENSSTEQSVPSCVLGVYYRESLLRLELPLDTTLVELKQQLEYHTSVPPSEQVLSGWPEAMLVPKEVEDQMNLGQLNITGEIYHIRMDHQLPSQLLSHQDGNSLSDTAPDQHDNKPPPLSIAAVRNHHHTEGGPVPETELSDIRSMSVDPGSLDEPLSSPGSGLGVEGAKKEGEFSGGLDELVVVGATRLTGVIKPHAAETQSDVVVIDDSGSNSSAAPEEFQVDDDDLFDEDYVKSCSLLKAMKDPLVPADCTEPYEVLQCFTHSFELRYGSMHPLFLLGSLDDVVAEATSSLTSNRSRKPMFVYLHHDGSVLSNVFCSQLLCKESIVSYLSMNFITWAWDLTSHVHRLKLLAMVEECFGSSAKANVDEIRADHLPVILLAYKEKGSVGIKNIIQGETNPDSLMSNLMLVVDEHNEVIRRELLEEEERLARGNMIAEQNRAYEESLQADRAKVRKKMEQEHEEELERQTQEAVREAMSQSVPEEPEEDCQEKMCTLRIRFPGGEMQQRRFLASHMLRDVVNFVGSKSYMVTEYKILTSFPRKDLTEQNFEISLEDLKLCPQETVFVEERT